MAICGYAPLIADRHVIIHRHRLNGDHVRQAAGRPPPAGPPGGREADQRQRPRLRQTDIVTGAGPGGGPDTKTVDARNATTFDDFFAFDPTFLGGIFVGGL
jgi:hypothetical protein